MRDAARQRFGFSRTGDDEQRLGPVLNGRALLRIQIRKRLSPHRIDSRHARKLTCFAFVRNAGSVNVRNRVRS
jgi:hypothetical protein